MQELEEDRKYFDALRNDIKGITFDHRREHAIQTIFPFIDTAQTELANGNTKTLVMLRKALLQFLSDFSFIQNFLRHFNSRCYEKDVNARVWLNYEGQLHNDTYWQNGCLQPAKVCNDGSLCWAQNGNYCSSGKNALGELLPAVLNADKSEEYHINGVVITISNGEVAICSDTLLFGKIKFSASGKRIYLCGPFVLPGEYKLNGGFRLSVYL